MDAGQELIFKIGLGGEKGRRLLSRSMLNLMFSDSPTALQSATTMRDTAFKTWEQEDIDVFVFVMNEIGEAMSMQD